LDIWANSEEEYAPVCIWIWNGGKNQQWRVVDTETYENEI
jgi:hypothetical protein